MFATLALMLSYIKHITVNHCKGKKETTRKKSAEAAVTAEIEKARAKASMKAINTAIQKNAPSLPKDKQNTGHSCQ